MVFTDYICRVNSNGVRKVRVIVVTGSDNLLRKQHLDSRPREVFRSQTRTAADRHIEAHNPRRQPDELHGLLCQVERVAICDSRADQLFESFRRNSLFTFIKYMYKKKAFKELKFEISKDPLAVQTRKGEQLIIDPKYDKKFRWDIQMMYNYIEKVGLVMRFAEKAISYFSSAEYCIMILTSVGLLFVEITSMKFITFVPLIGTYLRDTTRTEVKLKFGIDIYNVMYSDEFETLFFGSVLDKQDWITKIQKIQKSGLKME